MQRETFPVGPLGCNCSILSDPATREAIVVDPGDDILRIVGFLAKHNLTLKQILITHAHIDHIAGAAQLKQITGAPVLYSERDLPLVAIMDQQAGWLGVATPNVEAPDTTLTPGQSLNLGETRGEVLATPGHTPGSVCLYFPEPAVLLAGDTLFHRSIGRTDLPGGDHASLIRSIRDQLLSLPEDTLVIPGHGQTTSIGAERASNPFLQT